MALVAMGLGWWMRESHRTQTIKTQQTLVRYWATSEFSPEIMLQPGERLEAVSHDHGKFTIRTYHDFGVFETEFEVQGPSCSAVKPSNASGK
jgi:hypothetical protein